MVNGRLLIYLYRINALNFLKNNTLEGECIKYIHALLYYVNCVLSPLDLSVVSVSYFLSLIVFIELALIRSHSLILR